MRFYIYLLLCIFINNKALGGKNNFTFKNYNENNIELDDLIQKKYKFFI